MTGFITWPPFLQVKGGPSDKANYGYEDNPLTVVHNQIQGSFDSIEDSIFKQYSI